jgi:site-specific DNA-methyltransferase (adenine-specific)
MNLEINQIHLGDCMDLMCGIPDDSIDLILCDLPYGITASKWDSIIPLDTLWQEYNRITKLQSAVVLTASQPFTSQLVLSNLNQFKHEWIWLKNRGSNFANTVREPMKEHESVLVFSKGKWTYNRQMQERTGGGLERSKYLVEHNSQEREGTRQFEGRKSHEIPELRVPSSWQKFNVEVGLHPTQKPVTLFEYLIKTYSNESDLILDNCIGSGTTAVAAKNLKRNFIGIEKEEKYWKIAVDRISHAK